MTQTAISFLVIAIYIIICIVDRFMLKRGQVSFSGIDVYPDRAGCKVFSMHYWIKHKPRWSQVSYSLVDAKNPKTVVTGQPRELVFHEFKSGHKHLKEQSEFLFLDNKHVNPGKWNLHVKVQSNPCKFNPLYSLFPITKTINKTVIFK